MLPLTTVTLMLHVPTLLGASPVHVTKDTLEMEPLVKVQLTSYPCVCVSHSGTGILNADIDECGEGGDNDCSSNATCTNTPGGYNCTCLHGYTGNGTTCTGKTVPILSMFKC